MRLAAVLAHRDRGWQRDVIVFDLGQPGNILRVAQGEDVGTLVGALKPQQQEA